MALLAEAREDKFPVPGTASLEMQKLIGAAPLKYWNTHPKTPVNGRLLSNSLRMCGCAHITCSSGTAGVILDPESWLSADFLP